MATNKLIFVNTKCSYDKIDKLFKILVQPLLVIEEKNESKSSWLC